MSATKEVKDRTRQRLFACSIPNDEFGLWEIVGEDPNCDLGGNHHQPLLTRVEGTYVEAVEFALNLDGFWSWGYGGNINKVAPNKLSKGSTSRLYELKKKHEKLETELEKVETELRMYGEKV